MPEQTNAAAPATAADIMRPPLTTVEQSDHIAAAAYLMKHAGTTALMVLDARTGQPAGIITEADIAHAVADGKDVNSTRIHDLMTARPTVISTTTSVRDAAKVMTSGHFRHLPVVGDAGRHRRHHRRMPRAARTRRFPAARRHSPARLILAVPSPAPLPPRARRASEKDAGNRSRTPEPSSPGASTVTPLRRSGLLHSCNLSPQPSTDCG